MGFMSLELVTKTLNLVCSFACILDYFRILLFSNSFVIWLSLINVCCPVILCFISWPFFFFLDLLLVADYDIMICLYEQLLQLFKQIIYFIFNRINSAFAQHQAPSQYCNMTVDSTRQILPLQLLLQT